MNTKSDELRVAMRELEETPAKRFLVSELQRLRDALCAMHALACPGVDRNEEGSIEGMMEDIRNRMDLDHGAGNCGTCPELETDVIDMLEALDCDLPNYAKTVRASILLHVNREWALYKAVCPNVGHIGYAEQLAHVEATVERLEREKRELYIAAVPSDPNGQTLHTQHARLQHIKDTRDTLIANVNNVHEAGEKVINALKEELEQAQREATELYKAAEPIGEPYVVTHESRLQSIKNSRLPGIKDFQLKMEKEIKSMAKRVDEKLVNDVAKQIELRRLYRVQGARYVAAVGDVLVHVDRWNLRAMAREQGEVKMKVVVWLITNLKYGHVYMESQDGATMGLGTSILADMVDSNTMQVIYKDPNHV